MTTWQDRALCREIGPEPFFGSKGGSNRIAKHICAACTVTEQCLDYALTLPPINGIDVMGVWGGTSALELRALSRPRTHERVS
mgnify:CR=1 FL=1